MSDLKEILREEYLSQLNTLDLRMLIEMVESAFETPSLLEDIKTPRVEPKDEQQTLELLLKMIPDIEVSEIGWSDVRTPEEGTEVKGAQRQLLEGYLKNIASSGDFASRIASVDEFYTQGVSMVQKSAGKNRTKRIVQAISYLVFYKTLTKVITNFNASSAGFSFESFLAALVDGYQIPANTGTIADYVDRATGKEIPVSLKLYKKGGLEVGGSYTDLVNDLVKPQHMGLDGAMRYVVCTKDLSGEGLEQEGHINFYQFDFTLDNLLEILGTSRLSEVVRLPQLVVGALSAGQRAGAGELLGLPAKEKQLSAEELTPLFTKALGAEIRQRAKENPDNPIAQFEEKDLANLVEILNWEKNDDIFNKNKVRGIGSLGKTRVLHWVRGSYKSTPDLHLLLRDAIFAANATVVDSQKASAKNIERAKQLDDMLEKDEFLSVEESMRQYTMLGEEQKKQALLSSLGYLRTYHFALNERQSTNPEAPTNTINLGTIKVGRKMVGNVVNQLRDILNEEVTDIFKSLKILSDSLNSFFAGGLEDDGLANSAVSNANNISSKSVLGKEKINKIT